jgi:hypothetical protein
LSLCDCPKGFSLCLQNIEHTHKIVAAISYAAIFVNSQNLSSFHVLAERRDGDICHGIQTLTHSKTRIILQLNFDNGDIVCQILGPEKVKHGDKVVVVNALCEWFVNR